MKTKIERWQGVRFAVEIARHSRADRYTVRVGRIGWSVFVDGSEDKVSPRLKAMAIGLAIFVAGLLIGGAR